MSRGRLAVGCLGAFVVLLAAALWLGYAFFARSAVVGPQAAGATLAEITGLTPPEGYQPQFAMTVEGLSTVTIVPDAGTVPIEAAMVFTVLQADRTAANAEDARDRLAGAMTASSTAGGHTVDLEVVGREPVTVRGSRSSLVRFSGADDAGRAYRKAVVAFEGDGGPALLVAAAPEAAWDEAALQAVVASLRPASGP
jgi:hypothetical protein